MISKTFIIIIIIQICEKCFLLCRALSYILTGLGLKQICPLELRYCCTFEIGEFFNVNYLYLNKADLKSKTVKTTSDFYFLPCAFLYFPWCP